MNGATIRKGLARTGTTQTELARLLGITPQAVNSILLTSDVRTGTMERICEVLNLPVTFFYEDDCAETHRKTANDNAEFEEEKDREIQYLRGQVAAYETALSLLRPSPHTTTD